MANLLILPLMIAFFTAAPALLWRSHRRLQRVLALVGATGILASGVALVAVVRQTGPLVLELGNWPAPFGIVFVADLLSAILVTLTGVVGLAVVVFSLATIDQQREIVVERSLALAARLAKPHLHEVASELHIVAAE